MKNKISFKKVLMCSFITIIVFLNIFLIINIKEYKTYTKNYNNSISYILSEIKSKYNDVNINDIMKNLNSNDTNLIKSYGIDINNDSILIKNNLEFKKFLIINIGLILLFSLIIILIYIRYNKSKSYKIQEITKYIEQINRGNYKLDILENSEDELSILKNELYKITVMLKEQAEHSKSDKLKLKDSLSDISHQLKTPLTSITIMLDNIIDNPNMDENIRNSFIKKIYREISNINFLVQSLLKLSKFDANTINFINKYENVNQILKDSINNISMIADLRNINVILKNNEDILVNCDYKWQVEAITNILKNCIEHSSINSKVEISYTDSKLYTSVIIKDEGEGISKKDIKHIFERFYKCYNSSKDSIGIGLSLSKTIIEKNNGTIKVESDLGIGTTFIIKYWK